MATSSEWHEGYEGMSEETRNFSRALKSLQEELEAVDWYNQRVEATKDDQLRRILAHNRDEEIEHAMMVLEWIRRNNPVFEKNVKTYLSKTGPITELEAAEKGESAEGAKPDAGAKPSSGTSRNDGSLGIGSLKGA